MVSSSFEEELKLLEPRMVLVPSRVISKIIQKQRNLSTLESLIPGNIPKASSCWTDSETVSSLSQELEFDLKADQLPFGKILLLAKPETEKISDKKDLRIYYWRTLFKAKIRLTFLEYSEKKNGSNWIHARIQDIGADIFHEAILVLEQDQKIRKSDPIEIKYMEFCASFLDLFYFSENLLGNTFPSIRFPNLVLEILRSDIPDIEIFQSTRLKDSPFPEPVPENHSEESRDYFRRLCMLAEKESQLNRPVAAAILWTQANRVAPAELAGEIREKSLLEIRNLAVRLQLALGFPLNEVETWISALNPLLDKADQGFTPIEARLLQELQSACEDHEQELFRINTVGWLFSLGKVPLKKPIPYQRAIQIYHRIRNAGHQSITTRLGVSERKKLENLLLEAARKNEQNLRKFLGPLIFKTLKESGFEGEGILGTISFERLIDEFLDKLLDQGYLSYSELRDLISRNFLKMEDIPNARAFFAGDSLLKLDRKLAAELEGVYTSSDFYQRWLEKFTALNFGTSWGRIITRFITLPIGSAFLIVEALDVIASRLFSISMPSFTNYALITGISILVFGLINNASLRITLGAIISKWWDISRLLCFEVPGKLIAWAPFQKLWKSLPAQLLISLVVKPLIFTEAIVIWLPKANRTNTTHILLFVTFTILVNSRLGRNLAEFTRLAFIEFIRLVKDGLFTLIFQVAVQSFKKLISLLESAMYWINDWLKLRGKPSVWHITLRVILGALWAPFALFLRFYTLVLIEPGINPIKFPISSIAAKFVYPIIVPMNSQLVAFCEPIFGQFFSNLFISTTIFFLPDVFGFLVWETKENWGLFQANRSKSLTPVAVGPHGETIPQLLKSGFHSGTIPKLFKKLRHAELDAQTTNDWRISRSLRQDLKEIKEKVARFLERDFLSRLQLGKIAALNFRIGEIFVGLNKIQVELVAFGADGYSTATIQFENINGWLVGGIHLPGGIQTKNEEEKKLLRLCVAALFKFAGIEISREQLENCLPSWTAEWQLSEKGIDFLKNDGTKLSAGIPRNDNPIKILAGNTIYPLMPSMDGRRAFFFNMDLPWLDLANGLECASAHLPIPTIFQAETEPDLLGEHGLQLKIQTQGSGYSYDQILDSQNQSSIL